MDTLWGFMCRPYNYLASDLTYWTSRLVYRIYGTTLPQWLVKKSSYNALLTI